MKQLISFALLQYAMKYNTPPLLTLQPLGRGSMGRGSLFSLELVQLLRDALQLAENVLVGCLLQFGGVGVLQLLGLPQHLLGGSGSVVGAVLRQVVGYHLPSAGGGKRGGGLLVTEHTNNTLLIALT